MRYIILTPAQRDIINSLRIEHAEILAVKHIDVDPIQIKNGNFIVPEKMLSDPQWVGLITENVLATIGPYEIREISPDELIIPEE